MKTYVGIDVSKDTLAVAFLTAPDTWKVSSFANSPDGIRRLINSLPAEAHVVVEATAGPPERFLFSTSYLSPLPSEDLSLSY